MMQYSTQKFVMKKTVMLPRREVWDIVSDTDQTSENTLAKLTENYHCDFCGIDYTAKFDQYVELCFSVHPAIRRAFKQTYCIGGPAITPHIYTQINIKAGSIVHVNSPPKLQDFRIRILRANHSLHAEKAEESIAYEQLFPLIYKESGWEAEKMLYTEVVIHNQAGQDIIVVFEKMDWENNVVTAAKVSTMQEFRDMYSSEIIAPGQEVTIENVTIFFSDLRGSTEFYELVGDAHAYGLVRKHFDYISKYVIGNKGSVVKTIGDAVMAVFESPENGVKAALDIQLNIHEYNASVKPEETIIIKIGVHTGSAITVNSNDRLDYFGRTVNIAARIQGLSQGGDIILSRHCMERDGVQKLITDYKANTSAFHSELRGIEQKEYLTRVTY
jgi:adenylate cyclase